VPQIPDLESPFKRRLDFSAGVVNKLHEDASPKRYWRWDNLTAREIEIARLVAQGKHNARVARELARELQISPFTVETLLKHTYAKLHVSSRMELAVVIQELVD
jgi:DNA-binding CsgD family transcriptional regulator